MAPDYVVVTLTDRDPTNPCRRITLDKKNDCCPLGRASRKGADIVAQPDNGYIENPVVSRNHAEIRADFVYERVYVKDIGSTHGTFVNNVRIPATIRHPIRTGDMVTLGTHIKNQGGGVDAVHPSIMMVGVKFGMRPPEGANVFQVPDETSVEGSETEDTLGRARRFLHEHGNHQMHDTVDLTEEFTLPFPVVTGQLDIPGQTEEQEELPSEGDAENDYEDYDEDDVEESAENDGEEEDEEESDDNSDDADDDVEDDVEADLDSEIDSEMQDSSSSPESPYTRGVGDIDSSVSNISSTGSAESNLSLASQAKSPEMDEECKAGDHSVRQVVSLSVSEKDDLVQVRDKPPQLKKVENGANVTMEKSIDLSSSGAADHNESVKGGHPVTSKKRKAAEISKADEPEAHAIRNKEASVANTLPASGVQTEPSEERGPKRIRRTADILGYTALGGLAGAVAVFTTLVMSAPSFS